MTGSETYITQLTRDDLRKLGRVTNATAGLGVRLEWRADTLLVSLDQHAFRRMVWAFLNNGGGDVAYEDLNTLDEISLDPDSNQEED